MLCFAREASEGALCTTCGEPFLLRQSHNCCCEINATKGRNISSQSLIPSLFSQEPELRSLLLIGGDRDASAAQQAHALRQDCDVVTGTPARVLDFVETGRLDISRVRFFVLDEADRLLDSGSKSQIMKIFERLRKSGSGTHRLQVLMFSATLHSHDILALSERICENPIWVDLKGKDSVPEGVRHAYVLADPAEWTDWATMQPPAPTDRCHALDPKRADLVRA